MIAAGVICIIVAIYGFFSGGITDFTSGLALFIFLGVGIALIYFKGTEKERITQNKAEKQEKIENEKIRKANSFYNNSPFASRLLVDLRTNKWNDLDYRAGGCQIFTDKVVTPKQTYLYATYGFSNLSVSQCELLAIYLGEAFNRGLYGIESIQKGGGLVGSIYITERSDGDISVRSDYADSHTVGYRLYNKASAPWLKNR